MSVSVLIATEGEDLKTSFAVVGESELRNLWRPIIERRSLHYMDYITSAGITIDEDNRDDIAGEIQILLDELESVIGLDGDIASPVYRCKRLLDIVKSFTPGSKSKIYIG